jgi:AcrR family transcriptional regulator
MDELVVRKRGRARSETSRRAILDATRELSTELGFAHVTIEKIAARAHVGKPTIYRWWQSKNAILAECILEGEMLPTAGPEASPATTPDGLQADAAEWFRGVLEYVDDNAPLLRGIAAAAFEDPAIAQQLNDHLMKPVELALRAWAGDDEPGDTPTGSISAATLAQLMFGAILLRLGAGPTSAEYSTEAVFEALMARVRGRKLSRPSL